MNIYLSNIYIKYITVHAYSDFLRVPCPSEYPRVLFSRIDFISCVTWYLPPRFKTRAYIVISQF